MGKIKLLTVGILPALVFAMTFCANRGGENNRKAEMFDQLTKKTLMGSVEITAENVKKLMSEDGEGVILVDHRNPDEQEISMIKGAITSRDYEANFDKYKDQCVVVYCTIGGRSGRYASMLKQKGVKAANLKGGIMAWTHVNGDLVGPGGGETKNVHTMGQGQRRLGDGYTAVK